MAHQTTMNNDRVTARIPSRIKETIERAAVIQGTNVNQFMVQASLQLARQVIAEDRRLIEQEQSIRLSTADVSRFFETLEEPPPPNEKLKRAAERHRKLVRRD